MSKALDWSETALNSIVALAIAFGVPALANWLLDMNVPTDKAAGLALMYFVASTLKTYVLRRTFRWLEARPRHRCKFCSKVFGSYQARTEHEWLTHE